MATFPEPKLAPPGAGLPIPARWVARFTVPYQASKSRWDDNVARFERHSRAIEQIARSLTPEQLNHRFLVKSILGLEDSSRYWSAAMLLDHLMIAGPFFHQIISELSQGRVPPLEARVEKIKPPIHAHGVELISKFHAFWTGFVPTLTLGADRRSTRLRHPWFGPLNAHQWMHVLSIHHGVHLQQIKQIAASFQR
jgi:hypothetical protein